MHEIKRTPANSSLYRAYLDELRSLIEAFLRKDEADFVRWKKQARMSRETLRTLPG